MTCSIKHLLCPFLLAEEMGACQAKEEPEEARRARDVGMTLADSMSLTGEELGELVRREAMTPMKIIARQSKGR